MATPLNDCLLNCTDSELAALIRKSPRLKQHFGIVLLSNRYLAKGYDSASVEDNTVFAIMERIDGHTLEDA